MKQHFVKRGYDMTKLEKSIANVAKMERSNLLNDKIQSTKDPQVIFVCGWHLNLNKLLSIFKKTLASTQNRVKINKNIRINAFCGIPESKDNKKSNSS